jgi:Integrase core domain
MVRAPQANAIAEQFVGTVRRECLDRMLTLSRRHLDATLRVFANHYNGAGLIERLAWKLRRRGNAFTRWARVDPRSSAATYSAVSSTSTTSQRDRILGTHTLIAARDGGWARGVCPSSSRWRAVSPGQAQ